MPLALTDDQLDQVLRYARPLDPEARGRFLVEVAQRLNGTEVGDGILARVCRETQRRFFDPPDLGRGKDQSRWRY